MKRRLLIFFAMLLPAIGMIWLCAFFGAGPLWYTPGILLGLAALFYLGGNNNADRSGMGPWGDSS